MAETTDSDAPDPIPLDDDPARLAGRVHSLRSARALWDAVERQLQRAQGRPVVSPMTAYDLERIVEASRAPRANVVLLWPLVVEALAVEGIDRELVRAGAAATIAAETYAFSSESERGTMEYFDRYEGSVKLGNLTPGDGYRFRGRGPLQLTGRKNYQSYGDRLGIDLVKDPDRALDPPIAAKIFAKYFWLERVAAACEREEWLKVRKRVNGGYGNWLKFARVLRALLPHTTIPTPPETA